MIQKLESTFEGSGEVKGYTFTRLREVKYGYVYEVTDGDTIHYEAFRKKEVPICLDFAKRIYSDVDTKEVYPKAASFGVWAWTFNDFLRAVDRIDTLTEPKRKLTTTKKEKNILVLNNG